MNDKELFVRTIEDLHRSINSNDEYEVLRASALIRQLFFDGSKSLVDKVNRQHKHKFEFEVIEHTPPNISGLNFNIWAVIDGIDPRVTPLHLPRVKKNRDSFFGMTVAIIDGHEYSIKDLVRFVANVMGGVHLGHIENEKHANLDRLKELYIFSDVNLALLFIRSIGRIILESLKSLQYEILGIGEFEGKFGLSIHFALSLYPLLERENFILDIGIEELRNRVSIFIHYNGKLCCRFLDSNGRRYLVEAGSADIAYRYGHPTYLSFQIAVQENKVFLSIEAGGWRHFHISSNTISQEGFKQFHYVIGSNVFGNAETNMAIMEQCVFSKILKLEEQAKLREYFEENIVSGYEAGARFEGNKFLPSQHHPNFPENTQSDVT